MGVWGFIIFSINSGLQRVWVISESIFAPTSLMEVYLCSYRYFGRSFCLRGRTSFQLPCWCRWSLKWGRNLRSSVYLNIPNHHPLTNTISLLTKANKSLILASAFIDRMFRSLSFFTLFFIVLTPQITLARKISSFRGSSSFLFYEGTKLVIPGNLFSNSLMNFLTSLTMMLGSGYFKKSGFSSDELIKVTLMELILVVKVEA